MEFKKRLVEIRKMITKKVPQLAFPHPAFVIFFSVSDGVARAQVVQGSGASMEAAWQSGLASLRQVMSRKKLKGKWLRVDWVENAKRCSWEELNASLKNTKRNYFRYGLAMDPAFAVAFLEQELNGNAMLYGGNSIPCAVINEKNFNVYLNHKYGINLDINNFKEKELFILSTRGVFCTENGDILVLGGSGPDAGRRVIEPMAVDDVDNLIEDSSGFLSRSVGADGRFVYGYHPCFDRQITAYNALRHASTIYSMIEAWEVTQDPILKASIDLALSYLCDKLISPATTPDGVEVLFVVDVGGEIKLGANSVSILAMAKYTALTGADKYYPVMEKLALGILFMQAEDGSFAHVLNYPDLTVRDKFRIIYYEGEAAFGLMRLYSLTNDERWLKAVEKAFEHFIASRHWEHHDHWLSYCVNELTRYRPEERYFRFGIDNVATYLDFVIERITTFPTLLELMMAAEEMLMRLRKFPEYHHLLAEIDVEKFYRALHMRAHYLLNGHFWPEFAMYYRNPDRIVGSFFIRHHAFRVRIDDVEHYLSGFVAYRRLLLRQDAMVSLPDISERRLSARNPADPTGVCFLMYPETPRGFSLMRTLAKKATQKGLRVFYASYKDARISDGKLNGYALENGLWEKAEFDIPAIIDNAPPRRKSEVALFERLAAASFLTCHKLGGKRKTLGLLAANTDTKEWLIPSSELNAANLDKALKSDGSVIVKPFRSNRGRGVYLLQAQPDGTVTARSNEVTLSLDTAALEEFIARRSDENWMLQKYVPSVDAKGHAFDIRVPLFRSGDRSWKAAHIYARLGAGSVTSNLATGGSTYDAVPFLMQLYDEDTATALVNSMERAALTIARALQEHYPFIIDALGCDFGIADGRAYLFEVNSYPGMKGCLETATDLKADYFAGLSMALQQAAGTLTTNRLENFGLPEAEKPVSGPVEPLPTAHVPAIGAATEANRLLLQKVIAGGENDFSDSPFLKPGIGNPVYRLIIGEARKRGYKGRIVNNTHLEINDEHGTTAVFSPDSPNISFATRKVTENKEVTRKVLLGAGLPAPAGKAFKSYDAAVEYFLDQTRPQVLKPLRGSGGVGVSTGITTESQFEKAWNKATSHGRHGVVIEDEVVGDEVRLVVLDGETIAAVCRMPGYVIGDGARTIAQLVEAKNAQRKKNPLMRLYPISQFDYLENERRQTLDAVPDAGEFVRLSSVSNVARGGEAVSMVDVLHPSFYDLARRTFNALPGATQLGLDVIAKDFGADAFSGNATVIEVNSDPTVAIPRFAAYGPLAVDIPAKLIDFIEKSQGIGIKQKTTHEPDARLAPAAVYDPPGINTFPRSYRLQSRLLRDAAISRGLSIEVLSPDITMLAKGDNRRLFSFGMPDATLVAARRASNDKEWTKRLLRAAGIATPEGNAFEPSDTKPAWEFALECGLPVVIKPLVGSGGKGVFTDISSQDDFETAWAFAAAGASRVIVEPHVIGNDYRLFVVGNGLVAAARRDPAHVVGDGVSTILELIARKNTARAANPHHGAKPIMLTALMRRNLARLGLTDTSVLEDGRTLQLHTVSNIGSGGESVDETDRVHPDWARIAVRARKAVFNPPHVGIDLIAEDIGRAPHDQRWSIIEVNTNPDFGANHFPMHGKGRDVAGALVDALFSPGTQDASTSVQKPEVMYG